MNYSKFYNGKLVEMATRINCLEKMVSDNGTVKYIHRLFADHSLSEQHY